MSQHPLNRFLILVSDGLAWLNRIGACHSIENETDIPVPEPEVPEWHRWAVPAILEVLAEHVTTMDAVGRVYCFGNDDDDDDPHYELYPDWEAWRQHVAPLIADRIGCDPQRAIDALFDLKAPYWQDLSYDD